MYYLLRGYGFTTDKVSRFQLIYQFVHYRIGLYIFLYHTLRGFIHYSKSFFRQIEHTIARNFIHFSARFIAVPQESSCCGVHTLDARSNATQNSV